MKQVVVHVQGVDRTSGPTYNDPAQGAALRWPARGVQRGEHRARGRHSIASWPLDITQDVNLIAPQPCRTNAESRRRSRPTSHARVDAPQSRVQQVIELAKGEVRNLYLTDL